MVKDKKIIIEIRKKKIFLGERTVEREIIKGIIIKIILEIEALILLAPKMEGIILLGIDIIKITIMVMAIKEITFIMKMIEVIIIIIIMDIIIMIDITITEEMIREISFGKDIKINKFKNIQNPK